MPSPPSAPTSCEWQSLCLYTKRAGEGSNTPAPTQLPSQVHCWPGNPEVTRDLSS